jgi:sugar phosphate permease
MNSDITNNKLRAWAGLILLILSIFFVTMKFENQTFEYILLALAAFLVGGAIFNLVSPQR